MKLPTNRLGVNAEAGTQQRRRPASLVEARGCLHILRVELPLMRATGDTVTLQVLQHGPAMDAVPLCQVPHSGPSHVRLHQLQDFPGLQRALVLSEARRDRWSSN